LEVAPFTGERETESLLRRADRKQQDSNGLGFVVGVIRKFADDRCGQLAALLSFYGFLSFFPLTLIVVTLTAFVARRNPDLAQRLRASSLSQFPVVGPELTKGETTLPGSGIGLGIGLLILLRGSLGATQALQHAFEEVWEIPRIERPALWARLRRSGAVLTVLAGGTAATACLGYVASAIGSSLAAQLLAVIGAVSVTFGMCVALFWLMSPRSIPVSQLYAGAAVAAGALFALQTVGLRLVTHQLRRSSELYGTIGAALGLLAFFLFASEILLLGAEVTVVRHRRLWPRSLARSPRTSADEAVLEALVQQEVQVPDELVRVEFLDSSSSSGP
jgi:uncharacterized BrkB/YihY/UPF0761 family membrane protein